MSITNVICISDIHAGDRAGLCPPGEHYLKDGGPYSQSKLQAKVWDWWLEFWENWVPKVTRGEPFAVVHNGDALEGDHHGSKNPISTNVNDQIHVAKKILEPIRDKCATDKKGRPLFFMVAGTTAHSGKSAENEEALAEAMNAIKNNLGEHLHWELWLRVGGKRKVLVHFMHHIGVTGRSHYESSAPMAELSEAFNAAGRWNNKAPDIVVRSHRHQHIEIRVPTENSYGIIVVTPGWQLQTPFTRQTGAKNTLPQFGGVLIRQGDEEHYTRSFVRNIERIPEIVI